MMSDPSYRNAELNMTNERLDLCKPILFAHESSYFRQSPLLAWSCEEPAVGGAYIITIPRRYNVLYINTRRL